MRLQQVKLVGGLIRADEMSVVRGNIMSWLGIWMKRRSGRQMKGTL